MYADKFMCSCALYVDPTNAACMYNFPIQNRSDFGGRDAASLFLVPLLCPKIFDILFLLEDAILSSRSQATCAFNRGATLHMYVQSLSDSVTTSDQGKIVTISNKYINK